MERGDACACAHARACGTYPIGHVLYGLKLFLDPFTVNPFSTWIVSFFSSSRSKQRAEIHLTFFPPLPSCSCVYAARIP